MENIDFVIWMLLFPIAINISEYLEALRKKIDSKPQPRSAKITPFYGLFILALWFYVGYLLY